MSFLASGSPYPANEFLKPFFQLHFTIHISLKWVEIMKKNIEITNAMQYNNPVKKTSIMEDLCVEQIDKVKIIRI